MMDFVEENYQMTTLTLSDILDDMQAAEQGLHKFERRYWLSSGHFFDLYSQGLLDDGEQSEEFAEWAGHYKLWLKRQKALEQSQRWRNF
jgi:hypothetical protein